jgi:uncharacterized protein
MKNTYINLPIRHVATTDTFFRALGLEKNETFSSDDTTNARINENTFLMLLEDKRFASFVDGHPEPVNNNLTIALQFDTPAEVDSLHDKALTAGATDATKPSPEAAAFMYGKAFRDINGHIFELFAFIGEMPS